MLRWIWRVPPQIVSEREKKNDDISACGDGGWPPAVAYLVNEEVLEDILARYAERFCTVLNGTFAAIPVTTRDAVLVELAAMGFELAEEPGLAEMVNARF